MTITWGRGLLGMVALLLLTTAGEASVNFAITGNVEGVIRLTLSTAHYEQIRVASLLPVPPPTLTIDGAQPRAASYRVTQAGTRLVYEAENGFVQAQAQATGGKGVVTDWQADPQTILLPARYGYDLVQDGTAHLIVTAVASETGAATLPAAPFSRPLDPALPDIKRVEPHPDPDLAHDLLFEAAEDPGIINLEDLGHDVDQGLVVVEGPVDLLGRAIQVK